MAAHREQSRGTLGGFGPGGIAGQDHRIIVFPRRPGNRFAVIDRDTLDIRSVVTAPQGRHFYGHGAITRDGAHLLVAENDLETLQGRIGVYRLEGTVSRAGEIALPGPGPHEIVRHPGSDVFFVALGGLETHPDYGRTPFNLGSFRSQVVLIDFATGQVDQSGYWHGTEGVSLRHLAFDGLGRLYVGGQIPDSARPRTGPVLWLVRDGTAEQVGVGDRLQGYVSSVAANEGSAIVSSKESGAVLRLDGETVVGEMHLDGAGAVAHSRNVMAAAGFNTLFLNDMLIQSAPGHEFDNHGFALGPHPRPQ